jgi:hypothetical protein
LLIFAYFFPQNPAICFFCNDQKNKNKNIVPLFFISVAIIICTSWLFICSNFLFSFNCLP